MSELIYDVDNDCISVAWESDETAPNYINIMRAFAKLTSGVLINEVKEAILNFGLMQGQKEFERSCTLTEIYIGHIMRYAKEGHLSSYVENISINTSEIMNDDDDDEPLIPPDQSFHTTGGDDEL